MKKMINIGIVAHVDAGKTTLTEQMLYLSGAVRQVGNVDEGTAQTDWLPVERARGISVKASSVIFDWKDTQINLIDTPGHVDFSGEVERTLSVLDAAVLVVSAVEGIQSQTEVLMDAFASMHLPYILFINKLDRAGSDYASVLEELKKYLRSQGKEIFAINFPVGEGESGCRVSLHPLDDPMIREELVLLLAEKQEALMDQYLEEGDLPDDTLFSALREAVKETRVVPVVCGASKENIGVDMLLDSIVVWLQPDVGKVDEALSGQVYKVEHDQAMGKIAHVRLFSGMVKNRDAIYLPRTDSEEKVTQIRRISGRKQSDIGAVYAGEIAALCGLSSVRAGDMIGHLAPKREYQMAVPLLTVQILPVDPEQLMPLVNALQELADEDPLLEFEWLQNEKELHIKITGNIQLEILTVLLKERYGLDVVFSEASVIYKETPTRCGEGFEAYTMPKPCWAVVHFRIEPLPRGSGLQYASVIPNKQMLYRYQTHVETAVPRALKQGLYGWEVTDLKVTLIGGEHHVLHTHPLDFFVATPMGNMNGLENTGTTLLEPILSVRLNADESVLGKTISAFLRMRGEFDSPVVKKGVFTLEGRLPVADSLQFPVEFAAMTSGKGLYNARFSHYTECPLELGRVAKRRGIDPRDRAKWILHARQTL